MIAKKLNISCSSVAYWRNHNFKETKRKGRPLTIPQSTFTKVLENNSQLPLPLLQNRIRTVMKNETPSKRTLHRYCVRLHYTFKTVKMRHQLTLDEQMNRIRFAQIWLATQFRRKYQLTWQTLKENYVQLGLLFLLKQFESASCMPFFQCYPMKR